MAALVFNRRALASLEHHGGWQDSLRVAGGLRRHRSIPDQVVLPFVAYAMLYSDGGVPQSPLRAIAEMWRTSTLASPYLSY